MVEPDTIEGIFRNLDTYLDQLRQLARLPREELANDLVKLGAAKYYLQVAVECCIDVANHIIAHQGFRAPESYADSLTVNTALKPDASQGCALACPRAGVLYLTQEVR